MVLSMRVPRPGSRPGRSSARGGPWARPAGTPPREPGPPRAQGSFRIERWLSRPLLIPWLVGDFTHCGTCFSGDWDVHWGYGISTHGQACHSFCFFGGVSKDIYGVSKRVLVVVFSIRASQIWRGSQGFI